MTSDAIETNITGAVLEFTYARNHHYLKLTDQEGNQHMLIEQGLIRYDCTECKYFFYATSNMATSCPVCKSEELKNAWMKPQVSLIPESASEFRLTVASKEDTNPE
jgi:RNA polymerase subunit RPABC4/transcription elongation factor Spt4